MVYPESFQVDVWWGHAFLSLHSGSEFRRYRVAVDSFASQAAMSFSVCKVLLGLTLFNWWVVACFDS